MKNGVLNKALSTLPQFKEIIEPLKECFNLSFGYMVVFKGGYYYTLVEDEKCLKDFVEHVDMGSIFCKEAAVDIGDDKYYFTLWPEKPSGTAMKMYFLHDQWHGITASKIDSDFTELYWFTSTRDNNQIQSSLMSNKNILMKFIRYFNLHKELLLIPQTFVEQDLFKFRNGFDLSLNNTVQVNYFQNSEKFFAELRSKSVPIKNKSRQVFVSPREIEILLLLSNGFTSKLIAQKLNISFRTVEHHIEHLKLKTNLSFKTDLIDFYNNMLRKIL